VVEFKQKKQKKNKKNKKGNPFFTLYMKFYKLLYIWQVLKIDVEQ
jgi:hypothetical protein